MTDALVACFRSDADAQAQTPSEIEYTIQAVVKSHSR